MRVVMASDVYFPRINGVSTAIQTYRQSLRAQGVEVRLIAPDYGHGDSEPWIVRVPARAVPRDPEDRLVRWQAMHAAVEQEVQRGCDLIHIQTPFVAHYAGLRAARRRHAGGHRDRPFSGAPEGRADAGLDRGCQRARTCADLLPRPRRLP